MNRTYRWELYMAIKQFIKVKWDDNADAYLEFFDYKKNIFEFVPAKEKMRIKKTTKKYCKGHFNLEKMQEFTCEKKTDLTESNYIVCKECNKLTGFNLCLYCKGDKCLSKSKNAVEFCRKKHVVYLAYFSGDRLKVGTAVYERRFERLLEQGALYSIFIAIADGRTVRAIEASVANLGISDRVSNKYKIKYIIIEKSSGEIKDILISKLDDIKPNISLRFKNFLVDPEFNNFGFIFDKVASLLESKTAQLTFQFFEENENNKMTDLVYTIPNEINIIEGIILASIGSIILIKRDGNVYAVDLKKLTGWLVDVDVN